MLSMESDPFYKAHWLKIDADRMAGYRDGFGWDATVERQFRSADISEAQIVADFGCGPGKVAAALAEQVGAFGHVHALDINTEFLQLARQNAASVGLSDRVTTHLSDGRDLPFADGMLDRICARNTLMYVDDPVATLSAFHRVLRPGGLAHAIDGDWYMMVAEPVAHDLWRDFVRAASHACRTSDMGRKLHAAFAKAGFRSIHVEILANPDVDGRLLGMIRNMANYARDSAMMEHDRIEQVVVQLEEAHSNGDYVVVSPQFVVTGLTAG
jgi:ubiquinone/menaquinone biosynthesis C-methylase UbiE